MTTINLDAFFEQMKDKNVKHMTMEEFRTLQSLIEEILKEIERIKPHEGEHFTKREIGYIKLLASEYKRIRIQRNSLREAFLGKTQPLHEDLIGEEVEEEKENRPLLQGKKVKKSM